MNISNFKRKTKASVNIVPLVDVLTVLIFFFLLTMQFKEVHSIDITPPTMQSAEILEAKDKVNVILLDKDGKVFLDDKELSLEDLDVRLKEIAKTKESVVLLGDKDASFDNVANIIDKVRLAKIKKLSLQSNK